MRDKQLEGKAVLKTNRADRSTARIAVENCLLATVRFIANKYPGDVEKCMTFFNFSLLFGVQHNGDKGGTPDVPEVK